MCDGYTREELLARTLAIIEQHGWMVQFVEPGRTSPAFAYTVGLTRFHDHPELLVSGLTAEHSAGLLNELGRHVRDGHRFTAGDVIVSDSPHRYRVLRVNDPRRLAVAQEIYSARGAVLVSGLQVVWSNHEGQWPWDSTWVDGRRLQHILGHPRRPGSSWAG